GLQQLKSTNLFTIPEVILIGEEEGLSFLVLRHIDSKLTVKDFWERFGTSLAKLHRQSSERFGFSEDNYIGSLVQSNKEHNRWVDFFIEERLEKQLRLAMSSGKLNNSDANLFSRIFITYENMISNEPPA